jgi:hypothetical protein
VNEVALGRKGLPLTNAAPSAGCSTNNVNDIRTAKTAIFNRAFNFESRVRVEAFELSDDLVDGLRWLSHNFSIPDKAHYPE